jgi:V8-like Glu-specific endopeptidase
MENIVYANLGTENLTSNKSVENEELNKKRKFKLNCFSFGNHLNVWNTDFIGGTMIAESIIDRNKRIQIIETKEIPWRWICFTRSNFGNGTFLKGTGWLASPQCVITAGHNIYDRRYGGWAKEIEVILGLNGQIRIGSFISTKFVSVEDWVYNNNTTHDYGGIMVPQDQINEISKIGNFGYANVEELSQYQANIAGYPGDKLPFTLWYDSQPFIKEYCDYIYYETDTEQGQSGSPIWINFNEQPIVVGIHAYGDNKRPFTFNYGVRINKPVFDNIRNWSIKNI